MENPARALRPAVPEDQKWVGKLFDKNKDILGKVGGGTVFWRWMQNKNPREQWWVIPEVAFAHWLEKRDGTKVLYEIAVDPEHKRKGLGSMLLFKIGDQIMLKTDADHPESNAFYKALGFKLMGFKFAESGKKLAMYQRF